MAPAEESGERGLAVRIVGEWETFFLPFKPPEEKIGFVSDTLVFSDWSLLRLDDGWSS